jgi:hypothetical protein
LAERQYEKSQGGIQMVEVTEEKVIKNAKSEETSSDTKDRIKAKDDVIGFAETHEGQTAKAPAKKQEKPALKKDEKYIEGWDRGTGNVIRIPLEQVTALSRYIYVHNIFDPTPVIEHVIYKAIAPGSRVVTFDIDEAMFEDLRQLAKFRGKVHYNYVDGTAKNDPKKGAFFHRTFHVNYPEWIKPEDVQTQAKAIVSHYGIPKLDGIEKVLWPDFDGQIKKASLSDDVKEEVQEDGEE